MKKLGLCLLCLFCLVGCQSKPQAVNKEETKTEETTKTDKTDTTQEPQDKIDDQNTQEEVKTEDNAVVEESPKADTSSTTDNSITNNIPSEDTTTPPQIVEPPVVEADPINLVTISIECSTILNNMSKLKPGYKDFVPSNGIILSSTQIELQPGDTVYTVLKRTGIALNSNGSYIAGIGNIDESACGNLSGWMYSVNGAYVNMSASQKTLQDGDVIKWMFTCNNGRDLSFN